MPLPAPATHSAPACHQSAARLRPEGAEIHNNLGNVLAKLEKTDDAILEFHRALQISPNYAEAQYNMGSLLARIGRKTGSRNAFY